MWTEENIVKLKELWESGCSASHIAQRFGSVTRNAVLGKVHRLGLPKRQLMEAPKQRRVPSPRRRPTVSLRPVFGPPVQPEKFEAREVAIDPLHLNLLELKPKSCRYAYGERPYTFCGHKTAGPLSYCAVHARIVYQPARKKR